MGNGTSIGAPMSLRDFDHGRRRLSQPLASELRRARIAAGLTLDGAAALASISTPYLSRLERGERAPSRPVARRLVEVLRMAPDVAAWLDSEAIDGHGEAYREPEQRGTS
jgi:transcriptional regulator with XRE-family HTH domain